MMMAFDSTRTPQPELTAETVAAVRVAFEGLLAHPDRGEAAIGDAVRRMAAEAREKGMTPERLLVVFKDLLASVEPVRTTIDAKTRAELQRRLVSACIEQYYVDG